MMWVCPKCRAVLKEYKDARSSLLVCENNHRYDVARQGYVNLLLANAKASKNPGDNKAMITARSAFLSASYYERLANVIAEMIAAYASVAESKSMLNALDCGCGEGYYSRALSAYPLLSEPMRIYGIDISKYAVQKAASAYKQQAFILANNAPPFFAVASSFNIPLADESIDVAYSVFAPFNEQEIKRILSSGGIFIRVLPGPHHLKELKKVLYSKAQPHESPSPLTSMTLVNEQSLCYSFDIHSDTDFDSLLMMTPFNWAANENTRPRLSDLEKPVMTADFVVQVFKHDY